MKEERGIEISQLITTLERSKTHREDFLKGLNPSIGSFLMNELLDVTFERFHSMN
jgi:hypothetical protein